jgi:hypothetical protein
MHFWSSGDTALFFLKFLEISVDLQEVLMYNNVLVG